MHRTYFFRPGTSSRAGRTRNTKSFGQRYLGMKKRLAKMRTKYRSLINSNMEIIKKLSSMRISYAASEEEHKQKNMSVIMKLLSVQLENQRLIQVIRNLSSSFRHVVTNMSSMSEHLFNINNVLDNYQTCNDEEDNDGMEQVVNHRESVLETRRRMSDNRSQLSLILEDSGDSNDDSNSETKPQVRVKSRLGLRHRQVPVSQMSDSNGGEGSSGMSAQNVVTLRDESVRLNNVCCALVELGDKAEEEMEGLEKEEVSEVEDTVIELTLGGQTLMETEALLNEETQHNILEPELVEKSSRTSSMSGKNVEDKQKENPLYKQNLRSCSAPASCDEPAGEVLRRSNRNKKVVNYREPNVGR